MIYIYPRLSRGFALSRLAEIREVSASDPERLEGIVQFHHSASTPVATGGTLVSISRLQDIRNEVSDELAGWKNRIVGSGSAAFDSRLGTVLHRTLQIIPADAASEEVWNFLSLMVFPDVTYQRFPALQEERALGTPRNTLRRSWIRREVLGEILVQGQPILGEDELVGLFERTAFARNRALVCAAAQAVLGYQGQGARSEFARRLYKRIRMSTGPYLWDSMSPDQINNGVQILAQQVSP